MATLPGLHYNVDTMARGYYTYQSVWVPVHDKLPCQDKHANSEDLFTVMNDEERVDHWAALQKTKSNFHCLLGVFVQSGVTSLLIY